MKSKGCFHCPQFCTCCPTQFLSTQFASGTYCRHLSLCLGRTVQLGHFAPVLISLLFLSIIFPSILRLFQLSPWHFLHACLGLQHVGLWPQTPFRFSVLRDYWVGSPWTWMSLMVQTWLDLGSLFDLAGSHEGHLVPVWDPSSWKHRGLDPPLPPNRCPVHELPGPKQ